MTSTKGVERILPRLARSGRKPSVSSSILLALAAACVVSIAFLIRDVADELRLLSTADSDNVHWTLSQAEVEFLEFQNAVEQARLSDSPDLDYVVLEFDVFYSRMTTLATGQLYSRLRVDPAFDEPVTRVRAQLDQMIPFIDGPPEGLVAALPGMAAQMRDMRLTVRELATAGLQFFAHESDASRSSVAVTLLRLAMATAALLLALAFLLFHSRRVMQNTEKREQELSAAYARLNTILNTSLDAVIVSDIEGLIVNFNPAAEKIFGHKRDDVIGKRIGDVIVPEHLREAHETGMKRFRDGGELRVVGQGRVQLEALHAQGGIFPVELAIERAQIDEGDVTVAFLRDISHRVAAENELVQARDRALAGEKAKAEFLAMMTHEIRTPLNGVLGNLSLLEETRLDKSQSRYVRNMAISGDLLMQHVNAVLDIARFEAGADKAEIDVFHVGHLLQDIVDSQFIAAQKNGNLLQWEWVGEPLTWVSTDGSRLQQVLLNLVGNAIKFTQDGRVAIEAEALDEGAETELEIRVIDTGPGISEEDQSRIFVDFETIESNETEDVGGTGLGLGIARRFIDALGGTIGVESQPGEGSVFWLRIPVARAAAPTEDQAQLEASAESVSALDILLAEDNDINLQIARDILTRMGHTVQDARNGQEAVDIAGQRTFDLILMDIRMPVLDGLSATQRIREGHGPCRDVPIIAFSANVLPEAKERFAAAGMTGFLGKPLQKSELSELLAQTFGTRRSAETLADTKETPMDPMQVLIDRHIRETKELFDWMNAHPDAYADMAEKAHRVAGSAAAFGQSELREALIAVEVAAESADADAVTAAIETAHDAWSRAPAPTLG